MEVVQVDDVVAAKHRRRAVAAERHDRVRVNPRVDQLLDPGAPKVVHDPTVESDGAAGGGPALAEVTDGVAVVVEDAPAVEPAGFPAPLEDSGLGRRAAPGLCATPRPMRHLGILGTSARSWRSAGAPPSCTRQVIELMMP
jgi:hypothetical protein